MFRDPFKYFIVANILAGVLFCFLIFGGSAEPTEPVFISVPKKAFICGVKTYLNGLIEVAYDTDQNGVADQFTLTRQTLSQPLFYARDANEDGRWEMVYRDIAEDGINGNEEEYLKVPATGKSKGRNR